MGWGTTLMAAIDSNPPGPFASHAPRYGAAGWHGVVPLPPRKKKSPPDGFTGDGGAYPDVAQLDAWRRNCPGWNIGLRMNADVIGIDVDAYGDKPGDATLDGLITECGPLPDTWISTSRNDGISGIRFYRIPEPVKLIGSLPGIEIIQRHHRYAVAAPSIHPDHDDPYRWLAPGSEITDDVPNVDDLPMLPDAWFHRLRRDNKTTHERRTMATGTEVAPAVDKAYGQAMRGLSQGTRHDSALAGASTLVRLDHLGYPGAAGTLEQLRSDFLRAVGDSRTQGEAEAEWDRIIASAEELIGATPSIAPRWEDRGRRGDSGFSGMLGPSLTEGATQQTATTPPSDEPWPEPIPLGAEHLIPPFPIHVLPPWMADFALEVADDIQVPVDLPATLALGALSTLAAGHLKVNVAGRWTEHVNLYLVVAMPPSTGKSPAYKAMCAPVMDIEEEYQRQMRAEVGANADMVDSIEAELKRAKQLADVDRKGLVEIRSRLHEAMEKPTTTPKLTVGDVTPEALAKLIAENGGRMALHSTEGGVFDLMAGRYSDRANLDVYLQAWSGDRIDTARIGREATTTAEAVLTCLLTVQPGVIASLADNPELAGRGLTARFMYSVPPDELGERDLSLRPARSLASHDAYGDQLRTLGRRFLSWQTPATIHLDVDAAQHYTDWRQGLERRRTRSGDLRPMAEWTGKLESSVLRVAGLLHVAHGHRHDETISLATMTQAISIGSYWLAHAALVHDLWGSSPEITQARKILTWAEGRDGDEFTVRELYSDNRSDFKRADDTLPGLSLLTERGWIRTVDGGPVTTQRNKRSVLFALRPDLSTVSARSARSVPKDVTESLSLSERREVEMRTPAQNAQNAQNDVHPQGDVHEASPPQSAPEELDEDPWDLGLDEDDDMEPA